MELFLLVIIAFAIKVALTAVKEKKYQELEAEVLKKLGFTNWPICPYYDENVTVKSRQTLEKYDDIKFFKEDNARLVRAKNVLAMKENLTKTLEAFLMNNEYQSHPQYDRITEKIDDILESASSYRICVSYITSAGNNLDEKDIELTRLDIRKFENDPSLLMGKGEYTFRLERLGFSRCSNPFLSAINL